MTRTPTPAPPISCFHARHLYQAMLLVLLLPGVAVLHAQSLTLSGTAQDGGGKPVPFLNVLLYAKAPEEGGEVNMPEGEESAQTEPQGTAAAPAVDQLIKTGITGDDGRFRLGNVPEGSYRLRLSGVGYQALDTVLSLNGPRDLGILTVPERVEELDAVVVGAARPLVVVEPDRLVFNVKDNLATAGDSGFDVLRKAPGVVIDQNDNIRVEGLSGVRIFLDGKPSVLRGEDLVNYLKSLRAEDIDRIDIITQPSAKYDAEGNAGIIDIIRVREKGLGVQGSASAGLTYGDFARGNGSLNLNYRAKKLNLYGSYGTYYGRSTSFIDIFRQQAGNVFDAQSDGVHDRQSHNFRAGADWYINDKHTFGTLLNFDFVDFESNTETVTPIYPIGAPTVDSTLNALNRTTGQTLNGSANLNYQFEDTLGNLLMVDVDYGLYSGERFTDQPNVYVAPDGISVLSEVINRQESPTDITLYSAKFDYERRQGKQVFGFGAKVQRVETDNTFSFFQQEGGVEVFDPNRSNRFSYDETVSAAYASYKLSLGSAWKLQAGVRMEHTESLGDLRTFNNQPDEAVRRSYTDWFPSGGITWQAAPTHSFALRYNRRIQRPNYQSLNPFEFQLTELSFRKGNPFLQPQYINKLRFSHTWKYSFTTSVSYSRVNDFFAQVTEPDGETRNFINTRNVANENTYNIGVSTPVNITNWWGAYVNVYAYYQSYEATDPAFQAIDRWTGGGYAQTTFTLPWDLSLELSGWFQSPSIWGGTYRTNSLGAVNVAVQKSIADRWSLRLAANDIFFTSPWVADMEFGGLVIDGTGGGDSRQFKINLSYRFGSSDVKRQRNRETGLDDAQDRIGG